MRINYNVNCANQYHSSISNFRGHLGCEKFLKNDISCLIHETAFFREHQSNIFLRDYLLKNKLNKDKIKIVSLGCSTGEEVITQSMMLDIIKDKVEILGIDLSHDAIKKANSREYNFERPNIYLKVLERSSGICRDAYNDSFLAFRDEQKDLTEEDKEKLEMFNNFFETKRDKSCSLLKKILRKIFVENKIIDFVLTKKTMSLKEGKAGNCKFKQGDILDINSYSQDGKVDIILFRNTLYHFTTTYENNRRVSKKNAEKIIKSICKRLKEALTDDGIICFGAREASQMVLAKNVVPNIMKNLGFKPLNETEYKYANIWQLKKRLRIFNSLKSPTHSAHRSLEL